LDLLPANVNTKVLHQVNKTTDLLQVNTKGLHQDKETLDHRHNRVVSTKAHRGDIEALNKVIIDHHNRDTTDHHKEATNNRHSSIMQDS